MIKHYSDREQTLIPASQASFMARFPVVMSVVHVSVIFLHPSRNDRGPHRNCTLYTRVIRVPSAFLREKEPSGQLSWQSDDASCYIRAGYCNVKYKAKKHI